MGYAEDLAYIHDAGYSEYAIRSTPGILQILQNHHLDRGLIVELGCGGGWSAKVLTEAGYQVLGIDQSEPLLAIARQRVPQAEFRLASFLQTPIPPCQAAISLSECLNYQFDERGSLSVLTPLFERIYTALTPGGLWIFDLLEPGQLSPGEKQQTFNQGRDWTILVEKEEDPNLNTLTRRIITFRQMGDLYRRSDEVHCVQLYRREAIANSLKEVGFDVEIREGYCPDRLHEAHPVFVARKLT
ncbi:class I SAM-dependent methyltransferase [Roseofilum sp. BLCC_M143]|uniref:Class I SAM-dependent methyltransferase n=2 Tax=Roseofilum TaxID=1233426 RepID=A0ABT7BVF0_9CYAN|nr:class I SAM-dependent methyltransferase [Roseofilum casamattae BLCC-M143]